MTKEQLEKYILPLFSPISNDDIVRAHNAVICHLIELSEKPTKPKKRWRAEHGSTYWVVSSDFSVRSYGDFDTGVSHNHYDRRNYFASQAEAAVAAEKVRELFLSL